MVFDYNIDPTSFLPAVFATLLSIYNWYQIRKPANIYPYHLIEYGYIHSEFHNGYQLCLPLLFHNDGANRGLITSIDISFPREGIQLEVLGKAQISPMNINQVYSFDWDRFENEGYTMLLPTYPIPIDGHTSKEVVMIAYSENLPIDILTECQITVEFDNGKENTCKFDYFISNIAAEVDNALRWYKSVQN